MDILVLNWRDLKSPQAGGAELHLHETFRRIAAAGHRVTFVTTRYPGMAAEEWFDGVRVLRTGAPWCANLAIPRAAARICAGRRITVAVDCLNKLPFFFPAYVRVPILALVHHLPGSSAYHEVAWPLATAVVMVEAPIPYVYRRTPFLAISASTKNELVARGLSAAQIEVVDLGLDHERYRQNGVVPAEDPLIVYVGRVRRYKQIDHAIRMLALVRRSVPAARLAVVGEGGDLSRLRRLAATLGVEQAVTFTGRIGEEEKAAWLHRAALLVSTSVKEGWGLTVVEANACGVPVVAYDVPGICDSVRPDTGRLVPRDDVEALAREATALLRDRGRRAVLAARAVAWAGRFSWERCAGETLALLKHVAASGRGRTHGGGPTPFGGVHDEAASRNV